MYHGNESVNESVSQPVTDERRKERLNHVKTDRIKLIVNATDIAFAIQKSRPSVRVLARWSAVR